ncbi:uncharacterized protein LOC113279122 [Papaver somniferum]|uniref:uncharacterized protein LOC113279122 n=1 Tax=Papaver somniferum TaxID=3469 RepID=UPI000E6F7EE6|nr:uncharacterized protein LOC113279122 [Papaver somniferum]
MNIKRRGGNACFKLDISQAYDTLSWDYLILVLKKYGFSTIFCNWILVLLKTTKIFIMINGRHVGYFGVGRGLKQGDPLSPILYVIAADILSRNILQSIQENKIQPMIIRKGIHPSHLFFADDIFIFCNGGKSSLLHLKKLLIDYQRASGQTVSATKSKCFVGGTYLVRGNQIADIMNMKLSSFPDKYLGVTLVQGKVKTEHLWSFVELLKRRLASWIGNLLAFQARITIIKFVLSSIPLYNMSTCKWPRKVIDACERIIRNFLWSGNAEDRKCVTISWDQDFNDHTRWIVGNGDKISFSMDTWILKQSIIKSFPDNAYIKQHINMKILWSWLGDIFAFKNPKSFENILYCGKSRSSVVQEIWMILAFNVMVDIWFTKNKAFFENMAQIKMKIPKIIECQFQLPDENTILFCCDGASRGNPGISGYGFIVRNFSGQFIAAESGGLGITTNFVAEVMGTLCALEWTIQHKKLQVIVNSDSKEALSVFCTKNLPWNDVVKELLQHFSHMSKSSKPASPDLYLHCIHPCVTHEDNLMLIARPAPEEVNEDAVARQITNHVNDWHLSLQIANNNGHVTVQSNANQFWTPPTQYFVKINFDVSFVNSFSPFGIGLIARNNAGTCTIAKGCTRTKIESEQAEAATFLEAGYYK